MSSFNINGPSNKPAVTGAQNMMNDGGGGNLGYMQSGKQKKKPKEEEPVIIEEYVEDSFIRSSDEDFDQEYDEQEYDEDYTQEEKPPKKETVIQKFGGLIKSIMPKEENKTEIKSGDFLSLSKKKNED